MAEPIEEINVEDEAIQFEYNYYCLMIRELHHFIPEANREKIVRWVHRMVGPMPENLVKRNRYLFMICVALMTGNSSEFLSTVGKAHLMVDKKSQGAKVKGMRDAEKKPNISDASGVPVTLAVALDVDKISFIESFLEWEKMKFWEARVQLMADAEKATQASRLVVTRAKDTRTCSVHTGDCPKEEVQKRIGKCLDNQFDFLLYLTETYQKVASVDKDTLNLWLNALCKVDKEACVQMKGIRNDYMMLLVGYLMNNELKGPFEDLPTGCLPPLTQAIATYLAKRKNEQQKPNKNKVPLNPVSDTVEAFMNQVPKVLEGAFALLAINGCQFEN